MAHKRLIGLVVAIAFAITASATDGFEIKAKPKQDDTTKYSFTLDFDVAGTTGTYEADMIHKVTTADDKGYTIQYQTQNGVAHIGGQDQSMNLPTYSVKFDPTSGQATKLDGDETDPRILRMVRLMGFSSPTTTVNDKSEWKAVYEAQGEIPKQENTYTVQAITDLDGQKVAKIKFSHKETGVDQGAEALGTMWVRGDGVIVNLEAEVKNVPMMEYVVSGKIKQKLVKS